MAFSSLPLAINAGIRIIGKRFYNVRNRLSDLTGHACMIVHVRKILSTDIGMPGDCLHVLSTWFMVSGLCRSDPGSTARYP